MIRDRKKGKSKAYFEEQADLLSILVRHEMFEDKEDNIIDEVVGLFLAGS